MDFPKRAEDITMAIMAEYLDQISDEEDDDKFNAQAKYFNDMFDAYMRLHPESGGIAEISLELSDLGYDYQICMIIVVSARDAGNNEPPLYPLN